MKQFILAIVFSIISSISFGQISILSSDIGDVDDTVRYSYGVYINNDFMIADTNHIWDLGNLVAVSQDVDGYISMNDVNTIYKIAFFGKADMASHRDDMGTLGINITDSYTFFKKNSTSLKVVGSGGKANGTPVPIINDNADVIYTFPMNYGDLDSSDAHLTMNITSMGYIEQDLHRVNSVDGWGTVITPHGTYDCLRLKSEVHQEDTVYFASSGQGFRIPSDYTEYIWLAKGMNFPVVVAKVSAAGTSIKYIDTYIPFAGIETSANKSNTVSVLPNPSSDIIEITLDNTLNNSEIYITDSYGKTILTSKINNNKTIDISTWARGVYYVSIINKNGIISKKLIVK